MRGVDEPYQEWEQRRPFTTQDGRWVYPLYAPAYGSTPNRIWVFDREVDVSDPDLEYGLAGKHRIAFLDWVGRVVSYTMTNSAWEGQGIATQMFWLADAETEGDLHHAPCSERIGLAGEAFVRATRPEESCNGRCKPVCRNWEAQMNLPEFTSARPLSAWTKIKRLLGFA